MKWKNRTCVFLILLALLIIVTACSTEAADIEESSEEQREEVDSEANNVLNEIYDHYNSDEFNQVIYLYHENYEQLKSSEFITDANELYKKSFERLLDDKILAPLSTAIHNEDFNRDLIPDEFIEKYETEINNVIDDIILHINEYDEYHRALIYKDVIDETVQTFVHYAFAINILNHGHLKERYSGVPISENELFLNHLAWISPKYNGPLAEEISEFVTDYLPMHRWEGRHNFARNWFDEHKHLTHDELAQLVYPDKVPPTIGMTKDEVIKSTWGKPRKINKTTTAYSVKEQWVYGDGRYLYFEDGILTTIQE